jgi:hypothetical protein
MPDDREEPSGSCVTCQRRDPHRGLVCDADRPKLRSWLKEIPDLFDDLVAQDEPDPLAAGPVKGQSTGGPVSGSKERKLPIDVDAHDLAEPPSVKYVKDALMPTVRSSGETQWVGARIPGRDDEAVVWQEVYPHEVVRAEKTFHCRCANPEAHANQPARPVLVAAKDQVGYTSVASELDFWVQDWREARDLGERRPDPDVRSLALWLEVRLDDMCDAHPAVDEMFHAVRRLRSALRGVLGLIEPLPDYRPDVPCPGCSALTLFKANGSDRYECDSCPRLLTPEEFDRWAGLVLADKKWRKRHGMPLVDEEGTS